MSRRRAIVTGMIVSFPLGGVVWDYGQYIIGLEQLGYDVFYLEDTGWEAYDPTTGSYGPAYDYGLNYLESALALLSPDTRERWAVRKIDGTLVGPGASQLDEWINSADLFLNVSGGTLLRDAYMACRNKVLIDTDPGFNHFRNYPKHDAFEALQRGDHEEARRALIEIGLNKQARNLTRWAETSVSWAGSRSFREHDHFFTYAERLGAPDCQLPDFGLRWKPTRPPVAVDHWRGARGGAVWNTVMSWKAFPDRLRFDGRLYGGKEREFHRIERTPKYVRVPLEVAVSGLQPPRARWRELGWRVCAAEAVSATPEGYRTYLRGSRGEFSIAKNVYVATRSGWFSCRSACYLAAGLPVVIQDTGFSEVIPTGVGIVPFRTAIEARRGLREVEANYTLHCGAAEDLAQTYFAADKVVLGMIETI